MSPADDEDKHYDECARRHLILPPWGFWLALISLLLTGFTGIINLRFDVEALKAWRQETSSNRFTNKDWERERVMLQKEIELERVFTRSICTELVRLTKIVGQVPANDCGRP